MFWENINNIYSVAHNFNTIPTDDVRASSTQHNYLTRLVTLGLTNPSKLMQLLKTVIYLTAPNNKYSLLYLFKEEIEVQVSITRVTLEMA